MQGVWILKAFLVLVAWSDCLESRLWIEFSKVALIDSDQVNAINTKNSDQLGFNKRLNKKVIFGFMALIFDDPTKSSGDRLLRILWRTFIEGTTCSCLAKKEPHGVRLRTA